MHTLQEEDVDLAKYEIEEASDLISFLSDEDVFQALLIVRERLAQKRPVTRPLLETSSRVHPAQLPRA